MKGGDEMLKLYENIKKRRMELNMSQQELAERVGYRGKSMISQVESGLIDLPQSMILKFAAALNCSASDLMGWNEDSSNIVIEFEEYYRNTTEKKSRIATYLDAFAKLSPESQDKVIDYMKYQIEKENNNAKR